MPANTHQQIAQRFAALPTDKQTSFLDALARKGIGFGTLPIVSFPTDNPVEASCSQQRFWLLEQWLEHAAVNNISTQIDLHGELDLSRVQAVFDALAARHALLRTEFVETDDGVMMRPTPSAQLSVDYHDITQQGTDSSIEATLSALCQRTLETGFDLSHGPLCRIHVIRHAPRTHRLIVVVHHIVADGWSMQLLVKEFAQCYATGSTSQLQHSPTDITYADYAQWQRHWLQSNEMTQQRDYWLARLQSADTTLAIPTDYPRPAQRGGRGQRVKSTLPADIAQQLRQHAKTHQTSVFTLLIMAWQVLLHKYTGQTVIRVGVPMANRQRPEVQGLVGPFINTCVMQLTVDGHESTSRLLSSAHDMVTEAQAHQDLPYEKLLQAIGGQERGLFQTLFNHLEEAPTNTLALGELEITPVPTSVQTATFDWVMETRQQGDHLHCDLVYDVELFKPTSMTRLLNGYQQLLRELADAFAQGGLTTLDQLSPLTVADRDHLLNQWQQPQGQYTDACVDQLIAQQAQINPHKTAITCDGHTLTYAELDTQANQLAHYLRQQGYGPECRIGIYLRRSTRTYLAMLATLKAGAAYVPLDPAYPTERTAYMLADSGVVCVLTESARMAQLPATTADILSLDHLSLVDTPSHAPTPRHHRNNLAYLIYTSGSTGQPKGVAVEHAAISMHCQTIAQLYGMRDDDVELQFASINFDGAHERWLVPLMSGATLIPRNDEAWDVARTVEAIQQHQVTLATFTPSYLQQLAEYTGEAGRNLPVRSYTVGGEGMTRAAYETIQHNLQPTRIINGYGPTETIITPTAQLLFSGDTFDTDYAPIGTVVGDRRAYVLDAQQQLAPIGVVGELYLGGAGVARGYLDRPAATAERFLPNPFLADGSRLYATGDLVRLLDDGALEYLGRVDHQVKIRGFRIELGEIAARLEQLPDVREAQVVDVDSDQGKQLVAYVVLRSPMTDAGRHLHSQLQAQLPDYMVPNCFMALAAMPLTPAGKVDRKALPAPDFQQWQRTYVAPETPVQLQLAELWQSLLGLERVGLDDHFFELGGHSMLATKLVFRIEQTLSCRVPLAELFAEPTLRALAQTVEHRMNQAADHPAISWSVADRSQPLPLSYAQQRLYFIWQLAPHSSAYHIGSRLQLDGALNLNALQRSFDYLLQRHEGLRTRFAHNGDTLTQVIDDATHLPIPHVDLSHLSATEQATQARHEADQLLLTPFDLHQDRLIRLQLIKLNDQCHQLGFCVHHIIADGWSLERLVAEFTQCYRAFHRDQAPELPAQTWQFADYAHWEQTSEQSSATLDYWRQQLGTHHPVLDIADQPRTPDVPPASAVCVDTLPAELNQQLEQVAAQQGTTPFVLCLLAFKTVLARYSGLTDIRVGVPVAGRDLAQTDSIFGLFVNTLVLRTNVRADQTVADAIAQLHQTHHDALSHQNTPFEQLVDALQPERDPQHTPLFQVAFNYLDRTQAELISLEGLTLTPLTAAQGDAKFELGMSIGKSAAGFGVSLAYNPHLYSEARVQRLMGHFVTLLSNLISSQISPHDGKNTQKLSQITLLSEPETQQLRAWAKEPYQYEQQLSVVDIIEYQVTAREQHPALTMTGLGGEWLSLTYGDVNRHANRLAHALLAEGIEPDTRIGLALPRTPALFIAMLATLKAGAAFVPLDPSYPKARTAHMLQDSGIRLLLTHADIEEAVPEFSGQCWRLDQMGGLIDAAQHWPDHNPKVLLHGQQLAYMIYTSGSTGKPKGVAVEHAAISMHCQTIGELYGMQPDDVELQFASVNFDGAHERWLVPLMSGATLVPRPDTLWTPKETLDVIQQQKVSLATFTPSYLLQVAEAAAARGQTLPVRSYTFGGEATSQAAYRAFQQKLSAPRLINGYGPTETIITPLLWKAYPDTDFDSASMPVGRPVGDRTLYILDDQLNQVPQGIVGELYIGGTGLARGYLGRMAHTAERFVPDPFRQDGGRLYRTGDLVRYRDDGVVEFIGRRDHQVKLRGFRIELGEIDSALQAIDGVEEAVSAVRHLGASDQLCAWVVLNRTAAPHDVQRFVQDALTASLPHYMIPSQVVALTALPLTPAGKIDRQALPAPDTAPAVNAYESPRNGIEHQLCALWARTLKVKQVGITDNFFDLGGHSLLAMSLLKDMKALLPLEWRSRLDLASFLIHPTPKALMHHVCGDQEAITSPLSLLNSPVTEHSPIFCPHAAAGTVLHYYALATHLDKQRSVYGIANRSFFDSGWRDSSLEVMASDYIDMIKAVQPQGPYTLVGFSMGALLTIEITHQLEQRGDVVEHLTLMDPTVPRTAYAANDVTSTAPADVSSPTGAMTHPMLEKLADYLVVQLPNLDRAQLITQATEVLGQTDLRQTQDHGEALERLLASLPVAVSSDVRSHIQQTLLGEGDLTQGFDIKDHLVQLTEHYVIKPINTHPVIYWGQEAMQELPTRAQVLTRALNSQPLSTLTIEATHLDVPKSSLLLNDLQQWLCLDTGNAKNTPSKEDVEATLEN